MRVIFNDNNFVEHIVFNGDMQIDGYDGETPSDFMEKHLAYQLVGSVLVFNEEKWNEIKSKRNELIQQPAVKDRVLALEEELEAFKIILGVE